MNLEEVRANINHTVTWTPPAGRPAAVVRPVPVVIVRVVGARLPGYTGEPRVIVRFPRFSSEFDVDPEELSLT